MGANFLRKQFKFKKVLDYGTSTSSFTERKGEELILCRGIGTDGFSVTNLPFSSADSYSVVGIEQSGSSISQDVIITAKSASGFTMATTLANGNKIDWFAIGT